MYKDNSDLRDISFKLREEENYSDNSSYYNDDYNNYKSNNCIYQEKLNLTLRVSYESIEEFSSSEDILHIGKCEDVKKDIYIEKKRYYRIFGRAVDSRNVAYKDVLIRVFKYNSYYGEIEREEVDKSFTNEYGEFNFVIKVNKNIDLDSYRAEIDNYYKSF